MQDNNQHIYGTFNKTKALGKKFRLWEFQLHWNNPAHISTYRNEKLTETKKHADIHVIQLQREFRSKFQTVEKT
jgi:hypothetical protein